MKASLNVHKAKLNVYKAKLNVHKAKLNVYKAKLNVYKAKLNIHKTKLNVYKAKLNVHKAKLNVHKAKLNVYITKSGVSGTNCFYREHSSMQNQNYGGFWRRLLAFAIDKTIIYAFSSTIFIILLLAFGIGGDTTSLLESPPETLPLKAGALSLLTICLSALIDMIYFTWFLAVSGQTPGKMLMHLRVIQVSGEPITAGTAFLRWVGYLISGLVFFFGFLWIGFDRRKQGWHDKIAMTLVVHEKSTASQREPDRSVVDDFHQQQAAPPPNHFPGNSPESAEQASFQDREIRTSDESERSDSR